MKDADLIRSDFDLIVDSPGRINIIGEHTDYNNGFVLPTAIDKKIRCMLRKNGSKDRCTVFSKNFDTGFSFDLSKVEKSEQQWENYILGVVHEIQQLTDKLKGFDCVLESNIPIGSGISSSAALECGLAYGLNKLFLLKLPKWISFCFQQSFSSHRSSFPFHTGKELILLTFGLLDRAKKCH